MEILLVEDSLLDARVTIDALRQGQIHHRLTLVRDGEEALEFLRRAGRFASVPRPDLILLDLMLPKRTGTEVLAEIRREKQLRDIPVVVLTASSAREDEIACEEMQVDSYIIKPVNPQKFLEVVRQLKRFWLDDIVIPSD
jgi:CheY-like chemotaxis protein